MTELQGEVGELYTRWRKELVSARARIEAVIDFGDDEEVDPDALAQGNVPSGLLTPSLPQCREDAGGPEAAPDGLPARRGFDERHPSGSARRTQRREVFAFEPDE